MLLLRQIGYKLLDTLVDKHQGFKTEIICKLFVDNHQGFKTGIICKLQFKHKLLNSVCKKVVRVLKTSFVFNKISFFLF